MPPSTTCWQRLLRRATQRDGARVVIEEFMTGRRSQLHRCCATAKRAHAGHQPGPQAGGRWRHRPQHRRHGRLLARAGGHAQCACASVMREIIHPTIAGMAKDGVAYTGFLYAGSDDRLAQGQPRTVEFNCRLGDPEAASHPDAPEERPLRSADACHRWQRPGPGRRGTAVGPPHGAGRGDGRTRLPGRRRARAMPSPALPAGSARIAGLPCRHGAGRRPAEAPAADAVFSVCHRAR